MYTTDKYSQSSNIEYKKTNHHSNVIFQQVKASQVAQILHHPLGNEGDVSGKMTRVDEHKLNVYLAHRHIELHTFVRSGEMRKYEEGEVKHEFDKLDQLL
jgi:hypothetical protein